VIGHVGLNISNLEEYRDFLRAALAPLGYAIVHEDAEARIAGFANRDGSSVWLTEREPTTSAARVAFHAKTRDAVDSFHRAALAAGARDNGAPGLRAYTPNYYAAYVLDESGNNIEAVCEASGD
jgi:catechol 2,3-dioxygenase-like lactoylglutathione lyase family enzyme